MALELHGKGSLTDLAVKLTEISGVLAVTSGEFTPTAATATSSALGVPDAEAVAVLNV